MMTVIMTGQQFDRIKETVRDIMKLESAIRGNVITKEQRVCLTQLTTKLSRQLHEHQKI